MSVSLGEAHQRQAFGRVAALPRLPHGGDWSVQRGGGGAGLWRCQERLGEEPAGAGSVPGTFGDPAV